MTTNNSIYIYKHNILLATSTKYISSYLNCCMYSVPTRGVKGMISQYHNLKRRGPLLYKYTVSTITIRCYLYGELIQNMLDTNRFNIIASVFNQKLSPTWTNTINSLLSHNFCLPKSHIYWQLAYSIQLHDRTIFYGICLHDPTVFKLTWITCSSN